MNHNVDLVQRRRTMNQEWNTFFDSHLYDGRVIHMLIMDQQTKLKLADVQVGVHILANYCRQNGDQPLELAVRQSIFNDKTIVTALHMCKGMMYDMAMAMAWCLSLCLFVHLSICCKSCWTQDVAYCYSWSMTVCLSVCLYVCLSVCHY